MKSLHRFLPVLPVLALALIWQAVAVSGLLTEFLLPRLTVVLARIWDDLWGGPLLEAMGLTAMRSIMGFAIAAVFGVGIGIAMAESRSMRWFFEPVVSVGFPTPKIAFLPIFMLWLGLGEISKVALTAVSCFFIIAINSFAGAQSVDKHLLWAARSLNASRWSILTEIVLPAATPQVMTGLQIALPTAMISTLVAEMLMGGGGLGGMLLEAQRFADSVGLFAGIIEIALVGTVLIRGVAFGRRRLLRWHAEAQPVASA